MEFRRRQGTLLPLLLTVFLASASSRPLQPHFSGPAVKVLPVQSNSVSAVSRLRLDSTPAVDTLSAPAGSRLRMDSTPAVDTLSVRGVKIQPVDSNSSSAFSTLPLDPGSDAAIYKGEAPPPPAEIAPTTSWWSVAIAACVVAALALAALAVIFCRRRRLARGGK